MGTGTVDNVLTLRIGPSRERDKCGNLDVRGNVQYPEIPAAARIIGLGRCEVFVIETGKVNRWNLQPVVPPDGERIALCQFVESLQDGLF